ncbi:MAG TPA: transglutaminase-like cysteine peptidase [Anaerolineae bacterium]|nr:transglutaminase-like cysteine peptidase [Anaerolineae bacterium]
MTAPGFFLSVVLFISGLLLCAWMGYDTVVSRRNYVSLGEGLKLGAAGGLTMGVIFFMLFMLLALPVVKDNFSSGNWRAALFIWLTLPLLSGLFGGLGGWSAARDCLVPWNKKAVLIAPKYFGPGSQHNFNWYLQRDSAVTVCSIGEICRWLQACTYMTDLDQFHAVDYWQHPVEFEQTRQGDCEDHALWAWRKLIELGYPAEFMVGTSYRHNLSGEYHAWVVFTRQERRYLLEASYKQAQMIAPLPQVQRLYDPDFGVDGQLQTYSYAPVRKPVGL